MISLISGFCHDFYFDHDNDDVDDDDNDNGDNDDPKESTY